MSSAGSSKCGEPGLVDRVFAVYAESRGFDSHRRHMSERFFRSNRPGFRNQCTLSWKIVVSERRSMIAVLLNVGGGVRLTNSAKLYICMQTHYKHDEDGRTAPGVCGHGSVPLSHSRNVLTRIGLHTLHTRILKICLCGSLEFYHHQEIWFYAKSQNSIEDI